MSVLFNLDTVHDEEKNVRMNIPIKNENKYKKANQG